MKKNIPSEIFKTFGLAEDIKLPSQVRGCFPAGTRVWTDQGPKPIEQIQIGDLVLSQPETGGAQQYKRVVKTLVHDDKTLHKIYYRLGDDTQSEYVLFATGNHPFWVVKETVSWEERDDGNDVEVVTHMPIGWVQAADLERGWHLVQLTDGTLARVMYNSPVYRTHQPGVGWAPELQDNFERGSLMDFNSYNPIGNQIPGDYAIRYSDDPYLKLRVYNLEVEDYHTYYVGKGVWVHNDNCVGVKLMNGDGVLPIPSEVP
ncbi:polymorphic toxin-type HINT domain-containing protein [Iodobacter sp. BJB302]|uniref:polymorphic toxin-type HINT domain-containing protein n=1 Tax=Iodobacter sp. BJB302 TaxID=1506510 RepID=UPI000C0CC2E3|nr:polymorphic toxin-type HINT domain-containing protein [Iodobacter sp. BJB302]PHV01643.1 hypothetical protein CSQ88_10925 [Iodobacter sp. BJB302]